MQDKGCVALEKAISRSLRIYIFYIRVYSQSLHSAHSRKFFGYLYAFFCAMGFFNPLLNSGHASDLIVLSDLKLWQKRNFFFMTKRKFRQSFKVSEIYFLY